MKNLLARFGRQASRILWGVLVAWTAILIVILVPTLHEADAKFTELRSTGGDNAYWTVAQLEVDLFRLLLASERALAEPSERALAELRTRFDILYSREQVIGRGVIGRAMVALDAERENRHWTQTFLEEFLPVFDGDDESLVAALPDIRSALEDVAQETRRFIIAVTHFFNAETDQMRAEITALRQRTTTVGYLLIGLMTFMVVLLAVQRIQQLGIWKQLVKATEESRKAACDASQIRAQLSAALEALPDGFVLFDAQERLVLTNTKYRELYPVIADFVVPGVSFPEMLEHVARSGLIAEAAGREDAWMRERLEQFRQADGVYEQRTADGRVLRYYDHTTRDGGRVGLRIDVTEFKRARDSAEAANRAKTAFLANMSHEIRTPMNGILGMIDLVSETPLTADQAAMLQTIRESGDALIAIIDDVLDMARIEAGKIALVPQSFIPEALVMRVCALHRVSAHKKGLKLDLEIAAALTLARVGDPTRLGQILNNIIGNAVKFTLEGRVLLRVSEAGADTLVFRVEDTGIGMSADQVARIFGEFEQADVSITRRFGGSGLGMAIVERLVQMMQGKIEIDSMPGRGTTIEISIPLPRDHLPQVSTRNAASSPVRPCDALKVLVAEDNPTNTLILRSMLRSLGISADFVTDGRQAVACFERSQFDLLLLDIRMPEMSGVEALREIRRVCDARGLSLPPAIAATANVMEDQILEYRAEGFADVLAKPYRKSDLLEKINAVACSAQGRNAFAGSDDPGATRAERG